MDGGRHRAVSEVIGAVLIFGFLAIAFTIYQGVVIPQQNEAIEFQHNENVHDAIQDLRNAIRQAATTDTGQAISIKLGADYPPRTLGINPGASAGTLRTEPLGSIVISNVSAADPEVADYFGATTTRLGPFESKAVVYHPIYSHYDEAPDTYYENTLAFNRFPNGANLSITDQAVVDGRTITLIALVGNVSAGQPGTVTVDTTAVSPSVNAVTVTDTSGPLNVTFTTGLSASEWADLLDDELDTGPGDDRFVTAVRQTGPGQVSIILEAGTTYELRLAQVGVGRGIGEPSAKYIVDHAGHNTSVVENGTQQLVAEVRDRFNNPVSNVSVTATSPAAGSLDVTQQRTDANGRVSVQYTAPETVDGTQDVDVTLSFAGDGTANESVTFTLRLVDANRDGGASGTQDATSRLVYRGVSFADGTTTITYTLENTGSSALNVSGIALDYAVQYAVGGGPGGSQFNDGPSEIVSMTMAGETRSVSAVEAESPWLFEEEAQANIPVAAGATETLEITLDTTYETSGGSSLSIAVSVYLDSGLRGTYTVWLGA